MTKQSIKIHKIQLNQRIRCWYCVFFFFSVAPSLRPFSLLPVHIVTLLLNQHFVHGMGQHHGTHSASRLTSLYRWLWARLKCRGSLFTQLCGATAERAQTMGPRSPLSEWEEEWRPLDMATWSLNAPTSPSREGHCKKERKRGEEGKLEIRRRRMDEMRTEGEERR